jgi:hypothetical protein
MVLGRWNQCVCAREDVSDAMGLGEVGEWIGVGYRILVLVTAGAGRSR